MKALLLVLALGFTISEAGAQSIVFNLDNASVSSSFPVDVTVSDVTLHLSSSGIGGYSMQPADVLGFKPQGFEGLCIYPSSVFAADLHIAFSTAMTSFSIVYAPQELGCDASATLRVNAYMKGISVGTTTTNATDLCTCTWQSQILEITLPQPFDKVIVHYDAKPACQDYGPIFMADNIVVTPAPPPIVITDPTILSNGAFQFSFTNQPNATFTVLGGTNLSPFSSWIPLPGLLETVPGSFQFTDPEATTFLRRYYRVTSP